jgi:hypothetical protein
MLPQATIIPPPPVKNISTFSKLCHDSMEFPNTLMKITTAVIILRRVVFILLHNMF